MLPPEIIVTIEQGGPHPNGGDQYLVAVFEAPDQAVARELLQKVLDNLSD